MRPALAVGSPCSTQSVAAALQPVRHAYIGADVRVRGRQAAVPLRHTACAHRLVMAEGRAPAEAAFRPLHALGRALRRAFYSLWLRLCSRVAKGVEEYRKSSRPAQIFLMRHGESRGNLNESLYSIIADHDMALSPRGHAQALCAGVFLRKLTGNGQLHAFHSPYRRAAQTLQEIVKAFDPSMVATREDPLLREQEFGNFQDVELIRRSKAERRRFGRFWYRFPNGESGADVHNRAADFLATLFRQMDLSNKRAPHYMILAHGLFIRLFCMRYMGWTVAQFEQVGALLLQERLSRGN